MVCKNCGRENPDDTHFCRICGHTMEVSERTKDSKGTMVLGIIIGIMAVIIAVLVTIFILNPNGNNGAQNVMAVVTNEPTSEAQATPGSDANINVNIITDSGSTSVSEDVVVKTMYVANCEEWISLRVLPSASSDVITTISLGAPVGFICTASNGFYKINYDGMTGYVLAAYLSDVQTVNNLRPSNMGRMRVVNCEEWVSLRVSPSTSADKIAAIPLGAEVTYISDASDGFYRISYEGQIGYVLAYYLK